MRRTLVLAALALLALSAAACASAQGPNWTYAPPTPAPASQAPASGGPTPVPGGSSEPSAAPSDGGGGGGSGVVQVSAVNVAFEQTEVSAPAGAAFTIHFENKDASIPHDIEIKDASGTVVFKGDIVTGPASADYQVPALAAGSYPFRCTVHPNMTGTIKVGG